MDHRLAGVAAWEFPRERSPIPPVTRGGPPIEAVPLSLCVVQQTKATRPEEIAPFARHVPLPRRAPPAGEASRARQEQERRASEEGINICQRMP